VSVNKPLVTLGMKRTTKQPPGSGLCLAAAVATLLGENRAAFNAWSLSGYIKKMPDDLSPDLKGDRRYMEWSDATIVLALRGLRLGSWWNSGDDLEVKFDAVADYSVRHQLDESPALVTVRGDDDSPDTHAVVYDNELQMIRDPSSTVEDLCPLSDYFVVDWFPVDRF